MLSGADCGVATIRSAPDGARYCSNLPAPNDIEFETDVDSLKRELHGCADALMGRIAGWGYPAEIQREIKLAAFTEARDVLSRSKYYSGQDLCGIESERIEGGKCEREKELFADLACAADLGCPSTWHKVGVGGVVVGVLVLIGGAILTEAALPVMVIGGLIVLGSALILGYASHEESNQPNETREYPPSGGVDYDAGIPPETTDAGIPSE